MDQKNFIVAIVLSVVIIMGWQTLFPASKTPPQQQTTQTASPTATPGVPSSAPGAPGSVPATTPPVQKVMTLDEALAAQGPRVTFNTDQVLGSISLNGARIDDVRLAKQRETIDPNSPTGASTGTGGLKLPGPDTVWTASSTTLAPGK